MKYLDPNGLAKLKQADDARLDRLYRSKATRSWSRTDKAGAVTCWPVGGTPLKPTVDFLFSETPPASGDKSPENPSTISGASSVKVTRCGKNLLEAASLQPTTTARGVTWTNNGDGTITVTRNEAGSATAFYNLRGSYDNPVFFPAGTYTFSRGGSASNVRFGFASGDTTIWNIDGSTLEKVFTISDGVYARLYASIYQNDAASSVVIKPQLEIGSQSSSFEKGECTDYTVALGGTYYGGSIDLATGLMTVTSVLETITPSRPFLPTSLVERSNSYLLAYFPSVARQKQSLTSNVDIVCNSMPCIYGAIQDERCVQFNGGGAGIGLNLLKIDLGLGSGETADVVKDAFISWLEGKNIEVVYPVLTPFTVQLTPTQILSLVQPDKYTPRLNTVYTDAQAVQVGYVKSPIREEFELQQAIVGQGGNI